MPPSTVELFPPLGNFVRAREIEFEQISAERRELLQKIANYVGNRLVHGLPVKLTFICTHNSRRSQLSQVWAKLAADVYGVKAFETFSGGTEATAFNPRAVAALKRAGFEIDTKDREQTNPLYRVRHSDAADPQMCFSKVYNQPPNPIEEYCAVMTCSEADQACPIVRGADLRIPLRYEDPKVADDTPEESDKYDERSRQICREMLCLMSLVDT